jgi:Ras-related protein Rab-18
LQILDTPSLLADALSGAEKNIFKQKPPEADAAASNCCQLNPSLPVDDDIFVA